MRAKPQSVERNAAFWFLRHLCLWIYPHNLKSFQAKPNPNQIWTNLKREFVFSSDRYGVINGNPNVCPSRYLDRRSIHVQPIACCPGRPTNSGRVRTDKNLRYILRLDRRDNDSNSHRYHPDDMIPAHCWRWPASRSDVFICIRGQPHALYEQFGADPKSRLEAYWELFRYQMDPGMVDQIRTGRVVVLLWDRSPFSKKSRPWSDGTLDSVNLADL